MIQIYEKLTIKKLKTWFKIAISKFLLLLIFFKLKKILQKTFRNSCKNLCYKMSFFIYFLYYVIFCRIFEKTAFEYCCIFYKIKIFSDYGMCACRSCHLWILHTDPHPKILANICQRTGETVLGTQN